MNKKKTLEDIFNDDEFGILDSTPKNYNIKTQDERLIESFQEINAFFKKNKRQPEANNVTEFKLLSRLNALRKDTKKVKLLKSYDSHNLLNTKEEVKSVDNIKKFVEVLVKEIDMAASDEPTIKYFATHNEDAAAGYSLVQLIETSSKNIKSSTT